MTASPYTRFLARYLGRQRGRALLLAGLLFGGIGLQLANPQVVRYFLDTATNAAGPAAALVAAAGLYLAFALGQQGLALGATYVSEQVAWTATNQLRHDLTLHCLQLDLGFHKRHAPGELIDRVDGDATALANFFSQFVLRVAGNGLLILGILALLLAEDPRVGLGLAAYTGLTLVVLSAAQRIAVSRWKLARASSADLYGYLEERLAGAEDLRAAGAVAYAIYRLQVLMRTMLQRYRAAYVLGTVAFNFTNVLTVAGYALGLGLGAYLYTRGEATIGTAYLIVSYVGMLAGPLQALREQLRDLQQAGASLERIDELFALRPRVAAPVSGRPAALPAGPLAVRFQSVTFRYDADDAAPVLHNVSFDVAPGRVLGVLGRTGSGKTTLTRLLFRLYDPTRGRICLGDDDLRDVRLADVRARLGLVTQDVQLFQATIRDNLAFFDAALPDAALQTALAALELWDWVQARPGGLEASLAAGGHGLSAGEAQLLAFARVFLKDPGLVILDEASARLDPATEHRLERAIDRLFAGRTAIVIAHRLRTVQRADDILILEGGRVVEFGPRAALAADPRSRFSQLLQTGLEAVMA
jgi:ABC-type multidrug transport system fused ATPase/permease subunit